MAYKYSVTPAVPGLVLVSYPNSPAEGTPLMSSSRPPHGPSHVSSRGTTVQNVFSALTFVTDLSTSG